MASTATMTGVVATPDGSGWATLRELPVPEPAAGEALVRVEAFSINRGEMTSIRIRGDRWRPGQDIAGVVVRAATDGSGPPEGTRVAALVERHGWAELAAVPTSYMAAIPDGIPTEVAAALPMAGTTALGCLRAAGTGLLGKRVLVTGHRGGVGSIAVQLAEIMGASATGVRVVDESAPEGQDVILESAGGDSLTTAIRKVARDGVIVLLGNSSRTPARLDLYDFLGGHENSRIQTYMSFAYARRAGESLALLLGLIAQGRLGLEIGHRASWRQLDVALTGLEQRAFPGKAVLLVD
jgi:NADPH:quinone reductase-like Zn-dependent oxidoreductase